jgi:hypothetical protein
MSSAPVGRRVTAQSSKARQEWGKIWAEGRVVIGGKCEGTMSYVAILVGQHTQDFTGTLCDWGGPSVIIQRLCAEGCEFTDIPRPHSLVGDKPEATNLAS